MRRTQEQQLIEELCCRFQQKPRKCKKINDSGIGQSERIVCIFNDTFFYYPKIQQFNDLDFYKLQYIVPKAGVKLVQIIELKFPPRRNNERNYFSIVLPKNKILKYTKKNEEVIIDEEAEGQQVWTFNFDYDIISLPQRQKRKQITFEREKQKKQKLLIKEAQEVKNKEEQQQKKLNEEYQALLQAEKVQEDNREYNQRKHLLHEQQQKQKLLNEADEFNFHCIYRKLQKQSSNEYENLMNELALLQTIGNFKKRAEEAVKQYIDEIPYSTSKFIENIYFKKNNFFLKIDFDKHINQQYLANIETAHTIYSIKNKLRPNTRIPLHAFIKYKGFKVLVRSITPIDEYSNKQKDENILHGVCQQNWKTHFFILDDLSLISEKQNLRPYNSQVQFQNVVIHLGTNLQMIQTKPNPFKELKSISENFKDEENYKITYIFNINQIFPIDLDLQNNINQQNLRLRPEFVKKFVEEDRGQIIRLSAGGLMYSIDDEDGEKQDILLAKASQHLKYITIREFVESVDRLQHLPLNSNKLCEVIKEHGINIRYIGTIYKLTSLPYLREMIAVEAISREIKKIYRDYEKQYSLSQFKNSHSDMISEAYGSRTTRSLKIITLRKLKNLESNLSIEKAIDFLNLIFGNSKEGEDFWNIILSGVSSMYKIHIKSYMDLSHGYLLTTVCDKCGFEIRLDSSYVLFSSHFPFNTRDWIQFNSEVSSFTFPSMHLYQKIKVEPGLTQQQIINALQLQLCIKRALKENDQPILVELSKYLPQIQAPSKKYSIQSLKYYVQNPTIQKFETAFEVCQFMLPPSHPYFLQLYLQYSKIPDFDPVTLKRTAQNHSIRNLGITHPKTSTILSGFYEDQYLKHLIEAQVGVQVHKKMELYRNIIQEQAKIGKYIDCYHYTIRAIQYSDIRQQLQEQQVQQYFKLLMVGIEVCYKTRKIEDMLKISEQLWNGLQRYYYDQNCNKIMNHMLYYCMKGYLESSKKKYYLYKLVLVLSESQEKEIPKQDCIRDLRYQCRQAKNHINFIKEMLSKLQFGYTQINFINNFFLDFGKHVRELKSDQFEEGLAELDLFIRAFGLMYFEEALLQKSFTFQKLTWPLHKK